VPRNRGKNTTLIASIKLKGAMGVSRAIEGATDKEVFEVHVEHFLAPTLQREQTVVIWTGWGAPKRAGAGADRAERLPAMVVAFLLAGLQPHRGISMKMSSRRAGFERGSIT